MCDETCKLIDYNDSQKNTHVQGGTRASDADDQEEEDKPRG